MEQFLVRHIEIGKFIIPHTCHDINIPNYFQVLTPLSMYRGIVKSSSGESITSTGATATHPYRLAAPLPLALNAAPPQSSPDYPLRKTGTYPTATVCCIRVV